MYNVYWETVTLHERHCVYLFERSFLHIRLKLHFGSFCRAVWGALLDSGNKSVTRLCDHLCPCGQRIIEYMFGINMCVACKQQPIIGQDNFISTTICLESNQIELKH